MNAHGGDGALGIRVFCSIMALSTRVLLEVAPPGRLASTEAKTKAVWQVRDALSRLPPGVRVNVPEVIDENQRGEPFYKNEDTLAFIDRLRDAGIQAPVLVNKVVVQTPGLNGFESWLDGAIRAHGVHEFVLVGGNHSSTPYPGPTVLAATRAALKRAKVRVGNICIPDRANEPQRLLDKTRAGASFFTTQVLFETTALRSTLHEYARLCRDARLAPAEVFLTFSPVATEHHLDFIRWLGANVPPHAERRLLKGGAAMIPNSIELARELWNDAKRDNPGLTLGLNVAGLFHHNLDAAVDLANTLLQS